MSKTEETSTGPKTLLISSSRGIKKSWVELLIENYLTKKYGSTTDKQSVDVKDFSVVENEIGLGFNSTLVSLDIHTIKKFNKDDNSSKEVDHHQLKVKFLSDNPFLKEINVTAGSHWKEYWIYSEIIKTLNDYWTSVTENENQLNFVNIPELWYGCCSERNSVLVMSNVKAQGYTMVDKHKGLDINHIRIAIEQMALLHALSHVYHKKYDLKKKYPKIQFNEKFFHFAMLLLLDSIDGYIKFLKSAGKPDVASRIENNKEYILEKSFVSNLNKGSAPECLIHGDFWSNNLMFKYEDKGVEGQTLDEEDRSSNVINLKLIDWGNASIGNPMYDIHYLLYTSSTLETRKKYLDDILQLYHKSFTEITSKLGSPTESYWSYEDFQKELRRTDLIILFLSAGVVTGTLSKRNPQNQESASSSSSVLDHKIFSPVRAAVQSIQSSLAKNLLSLLHKPGAQKLTRMMMSKAIKPMMEELCSGENDVLTTRIKDLLCEADEKGLFTDPSVPSVQ